MKLMCTVSPLRIKGLGFDSHCSHNRRKLVPLKQNVVYYSYASDHMKLWHYTRGSGGTRRRILLTITMRQTARPTMQKPTISMLTIIGRYEGSQSDCILLATNVNFQSINKHWVSKCAHKFTYCAKSERRKRKNCWRTTMPKKKLYLKKSTKC